MGRPRKKRKELPQRVYFHKGLYFFVDYGGKWISLGKDFKAAMLKWSELVSIPEHLTTMGQIIDRYMKEVAPQKAEKTYHENLLQIKQLKEVFGDMQPHTIRPVHIYKYLDIRGKTAPVAANREKALLSHVFSLAIRWGLIDKNPCREVKRIKEKRRDRYITDVELKTLIDNAPDHIKCIIEIGYLTSLRISDILNIRLSDITADGLTVQASKTGSKQSFELTPELAEVIGRARSLKRPIKSIYLFTGKRGQRFTYWGFKSAWYKLIGDLEIENIHFHDLRGKALTDTKKAGGDAQTLGGNKSSSATDGYIRAKEFRKVKTVLSIKKDTQSRE
jgi:integrase